MTSNKRQREIVLFLGAGFSRGAGLPTMGQFGEESDYEFMQIDERHKDDRYAGQMLYNAGRVFQRFQQYCEQGGKSIDVDVNNMEDIFCIAEAMREAEINPILDLGNINSSYSVDSLINQIQFWLWKIYQMFPIIDKIRLKSDPMITPEVYKEFFKFLKQKEIKSLLTIITTNYDLVAEYYSWGLDLGFTYPLEKNRDYEQIKACPESSESYLSNGLDLPLICKLHGSVNFFQHSNDSDNKLAICDDLVKVGQKIGKTCIGAHENAAQIHEGMRPSIFAFDAIWNLRERYGDSLVPAIIPPTYSKLQGQNWLRRIWNRAFKAIQQARVIIFIGYSMPPSDGFMRAMFQGALASRRDNGPEIYVIDPFQNKEKPGEVYENLFVTLKEKNKESWLMKQTFAEAWKDGKLKRILESFS